MSPLQYFLDASFLISLIDSGDINHPKALTLFEKIKRTDNEFFLSDVFLNEVFTGLGKRCERGGKSKNYAFLADKVSSFIFNRPILCLYDLLPKKYKDVIAMMVKAEGTLSFHDSLIILFLKEVPDVTLVTFDRDFEKVKGLKILCE